MGPKGRAAARALRPEEILVELVLTAGAGFRSHPAQRVVELEQIHQDPLMLRILLVVPPNTQLTIGDPSCLMTYVRNPHLISSKAQKRWRKAIST